LIFCRETRQRDTFFSELRDLGGENNILVSLEQIVNKRKQAKNLRKYFSMKTVFCKKNRP